MTACENNSISVVLATYNGEKHIRAQISSILRQLRDCDEVIITDDMSTDLTVSMINEFSDSRVRVIYSDSNKGPIGNFENGIKNATRDIIVLADQDDVWLDGRLDIVRSALLNNKSQYVLAVLNSAVVDEQLELIQPSVFKFLRSGPGLLKNIYKNTYIGCHMAFSRKIVPLILPFPKKIPMHDIWIGLVSEMVGSVVFINTISMLFRRTGYNFTQPRYSWKTRFCWRFSLVLSLIVFFMLNIKIILKKYGGGVYEKPN